jgi:hypothetical protein
MLTFCERWELIFQSFSGGKLELCIASEFLIHSFDWDFLVAMYENLLKVLLFFVFVFVCLIFPLSWELKPKLENFLNCSGDPWLKHSPCELANRTFHANLSANRECDHNCVGYKEKCLWSFYEKNALNEHKFCTRGWIKCWVGQIVKNFVSLPKCIIYYMLSFYVCSYIAYFEQELVIRGKFFSENERTLRQVHFSLCCSNQHWTQYIDKDGLKFRILKALL